MSAPLNSELPQSAGPSQQAPQDPQAGNQPSPSQPPLSPATAQKQKQRQDEKEREARRRQAEAVKELRGELEKGRLAICVGSGVTISSAFGERARLSWAGLITNGFDYIEDQAAVLSEQKETKYDIKRGRELLQLPNPSVEDGLDAAHRLQRVLSKRDDLYTGWLHHQFKSLYDSYVTDKSILDSLRRLQRSNVMLISTNYDDLLEKHCNIAHIDCSDSQGLADFRRGKLNAVFHPHGFWRNPKTIVLSGRDYWDVTANDAVQETLKFILDTKTVLFVGCGGGLADPNFGKLMEWIGEKDKHHGARHYLLLQKAEENPVAQLALHHVQCESFGRFADIADISRWLMDLLTDKQHDDVSEIPILSVRRTLQEWLAPLDQSAFLAYHTNLQGPVTNDWLINRNDTIWQRNGSSLVWVNGDGWLGKTMLCSSLIVSTQQRCRPADARRSRDSLAYFFCTPYKVKVPSRGTLRTHHYFNDFLRTVILQLCPLQEDGIFDVLRDLYSRCTMHHPARRPNDAELEDVLLRILGQLCNVPAPAAASTKEAGETYLIIDGLNALPRHMRDGYLNFIAKIQRKKFKHFHLLVASRQFRGLSDLVRRSKKWTVITIDSDTVKDAMSKYVRHCCKHDAQLQRKGMTKAMRSWIGEELASSGNSFAWIYWKLQDMKKLEEFTTKTVEKFLRPDEDENDADSDSSQPPKKRLKTSQRREQTASASEWLFSLVMISRPYRARGNAKAVELEKSPRLGSPLISRLRKYSVSAGRAQRAWRCEQRRPASILEGDVRQASGMGFSELVDLTLGDMPRS